jgi:hypothetical protein
LGGASTAGRMTAALGFNETRANHSRVERSVRCSQGATAARRAFHDPVIGLDARRRWPSASSSRCSGARVIRAGRRRVTIGPVIRANIAADTPLRLWLLITSHSPTCCKETYRLLEVAREEGKVT